MRVYAPVLVGLLALFTVACGGGSSDNPPANQVTSLSWHLTGLEPLGSGYVYEGWVVVNGTPESTGRFQVDALGMPDLESAPASDAMAAGATAWVLTIEPDPDPDPSPSETKLLGGDFVNGVAMLEVSHAAALGSDFTSAMGSFILATPTSAVTSDDNQGIWWLDPGAGMSSLDLPTLPAGWAYEGWVVTGSGPLSTGRFTDPGVADSDGAGPDKGPDSDGPPFPGQDYVNPALDLVGLTAVISVEPSPDDSPNPFALKPLVTSPVLDVLAPTPQAMSNNAAATNPEGVAQFD